MKKTLLILSFIPFFGNAQQPKLIDKVIGTVGDKIVLLSEVEAQYQQYLAQSPNLPADSKCMIFNDLLMQKMLLTQALRDSIEVSDEELESEMERRMRYFISRIGSKEKLEEYYQKSIVEIKEELRDDVKEMLLSQRMQGKITKDVKVTPAEVKAFYLTIPEDSLPFFDAEVQIGQVVIFPKVSKEQKLLAKEKINELRNRILAGEKFSSLAMIYSEDPGSAANGGELGFLNRGELVSEFEAVAYRLKKNEVSEIVETKFGYHIIQLIERRGESINARHILIKPKTTSFDLKEAKIKMDSIRGLLLQKNMTFEDAIKNFSEDENTKNSGGMIMNAQTGTLGFSMDQLEPSLYFIIDTMKAGQISTSLLYNTPEGTQGYRIVYLKSETLPHKADIREDYSKIQAAALNAKQQQEMEKWLNDRIENTYIKIDDAYLSCPVIEKWINKYAVTQDN